MPQEKIIAALDIGSTAVLLLVVKCLEDGSLELVNEYVAVTRLGENLYKTGVLAEDAMEKTVKAALEMQSIAMSDGAQNLIVSASSIIRDAENRSRFLLKCHQKLSVYPQVLSCKEEAKFTFMGATMDLDENIPVFLINIGGGSSEIVYGSKNEIVNSSCLNVGSMKINEMFRLSNASRSFLPSLSPPKQARNYIKKELQDKVDSEVYAWLFKNDPIVLVCGGIAATYAALLKKQPIYDRNQINHTESSRYDLMNCYKMLYKMKAHQRIKVPGMDPDRAEIMPAGLLSLATILKYYKFQHFSITAKGMRLGLIKYFIEK
jgi:exopolyphosphatase/guanosine-5'-triphosphate,3'-diphosphate pyrophosphatase